MKILEKDGVYQKVSNEFIAEDKVKKYGWRYSSREEWKKNVRDIKKIEKVVVTPEDQKVAKEKRREDNKKIKQIK